MTSSIGSGIVSDVTAQGLISNALFLGDPENYNSSLADCVWKRMNERASCPDPDIEIILYTNHSQPQKVSDWPARYN